MPISPYSSPHVLEPPVRALQVDVQRQRPTRVVVVDPGGRKDQVQTPVAVHVDGGHVVRADRRQIGPLAREPAGPAPVDVAEQLARHAVGRVDDDQVLVPVAVEVDDPAQVSHCPWAAPAAPSPSRRRGRACRSTSAPARCSPVRSAERCRRSRRCRRRSRWMVSMIPFALTYRLLPPSSKLPAANASNPRCTQDVPLMVPRSFRATAYPTGTRCAPGASASSSVGSHPDRRATTQGGKR